MHKRAGAARYQIDRRWPAAAGGAAPRRQHGAERPIAPLPQPPHRQLHHARGTWALDIKATVRPVGQSVVEAERRRTQRACSGSNTAGWISWASGAMADTLVLCRRFNHGWSQIQPRLVADTAVLKLSPRGRIVSIQATDRLSRAWRRQRFPTRQRVCARCGIGRKLKRVPRDYSTTKQQGLPSGSPSSF